MMISNTWLMRAMPAMPGGGERGGEPKPPPEEKKASCNIWIFEFFLYLLKPTWEETRGRKARNSTASKNRMKIQNSWLWLWFIHICISICICLLWRWRTETVDYKQGLTKTADQKWGWRMTIRNEWPSLRRQKSKRFDSQQEVLIQSRKKSWYRVPPSTTALLVRYLNDTHCIYQRP